MFLDFLTASANNTKERENTMSNIQNKINDIQNSAAAITARLHAAGASKVSKKDLVRLTAKETGFSPVEVNTILQLVSDKPPAEKITLSDGTQVSLRGKAPKGKEEEAKAARAARKAGLTDPEPAKGKAKK